MARARVIRKQDRCFVELPKEFLSVEEIELFPLRDGYYFLSMPLGPSQKPETKRTGATGEEIAVLHRLQSIKFGDRTPDNVSKALSGPEKEVLKRLEDKGWVNVFRGNKYKNGVYNIADEVYPMLKSQDAPQAVRNPSAEQRPAAPQKAAPAESLPPSYALLMKQGYMVIKDQKDAKALSEMLKSDMKSGSVVGIKGFDGSFYVVTRDYFSSASKAILDALKDRPADVATIAGASGLDADGARAVLQHLAESGDVIEKRKGTYAAV
jgi:ribosomal protein S25